MHPSWFEPESCCGGYPRGGNPHCNNDDDKKSASWEFYEPPENISPVEFCRDTSLHGLQYVGQPERHLIERIFWLVAFIAAATLAGVLIYKLLDNYDNNPVETVFAGNQMPIENVPFPAITICNVNNIKMSKLLAYKDWAENLLEQEKLASSSTSTSTSKPFNWEDLMLACAAMSDFRNICASQTFALRIFAQREKKTKWNNMFANISNYRIENRTRDYKKYHSPKKAYKFGSQSCKEMILFCSWLDDMVDCDEFFQEIETDYGYCCTFNTIPLSILLKYFNDSRDSEERVAQWRVADLSWDNLLFTKESRKRSQPLRQKHPGMEGGLTVVLDPDLGEYSCSNTDSEGFVVGVNGPLDFPRMKANGLLVKTDAEIYINVRPEITMSDDSIRNVALDKRNCLFDAEYQLPHYSKYTTSNCLGECIANKIMEQCNCVLYHMPRNYTDSVCHPDQHRCASGVRKRIIKRGLAETCESCLPTCTGIEYRAEVSGLNIRKFNVDKMFEVYPELRNKSDNISIMHVYFGVDSTYPRIRKEVYSKIDLISNAGGLLGLCMGFSMLSLLEIVYYCTIRLCFRCRRRRHLEHFGTPLKKGNGSSEEGSIFSKQNWFWKTVSRRSPSDDNVVIQKDADDDHVFKIVRRHHHPKLYCISTCELCGKMLQKRPLD